MNKKYICSIRGRDFFIGMAPHWEFTIEELSLIQIAVDQQRVPGILRPGIEPANIW
jgi:hypothetical protein